MPSKIPTAITCTDQPSAISGQTAVSRKSLVACYSSSTAK